VARHLISGEGYTFDGTNPTARRGPTVVYFFAAVLWLGGDSLWSIVIAQWLADAGTAIVLFFIAYELFQDRRVAIVASSLFALYGSGLVYSLRGWSEPVFTLVLAGFTLSLLRALRQPSPWRFALCGGLLGLTVLARPYMQFYPLVVLPLMWWRLARPWRQVLARFAVFCGIFAAVLLPWIVRNYLIFQAFIPGSSHSGNPLYQGNFTLNQPKYLRYRTIKYSYPALHQVLEARFGPAPEYPDLYSYAQAKGLNEYEVDRIAFQEAVKIIRAFPGRYIVASLVRCARFWFGNRFVGLVMDSGSSWGYLVVAANGILLGLAAVGTVCFRGAWRRSAVPLFALLAYTTILYSLTLALARYSVPIMPYVMVLAAHTIVCILPAKTIIGRHTSACPPG
jgi:4-amino-4-deoxy-L-arabinose transferase-like glycosyltransferase